MRVLFLTDSLSDLDGVGRYAVRLIRAMEAERPDLEVEVLLARKHRPTSAEVPGHWKVEVGLPPDYFFYMSPLRFWVSYLKSLWGSWRAARRADLVHAIKDYPHNLVGLRAARLAGVPCVATAHGTYSVQPLLNRRHAARALRAYRGFARIICVSRYTKQRLSELLQPHGFDLHKLCVVPNAVSTEHYAAQPALSERAWQRVPFSLGIGELKERKGHHLALEAWCRVAERHPELHHFLVGKGAGDDYQQRLERMVREAGYDQRVHFLGNVTEDEKIDLLRRAEVFVHTPVTSSEGGFEGFGIVYLEAAASGTPCIGTRDSGAEDAISDGKSGLLVEQTVEAVEGALERLLSDEELRQGMREAAPTVARGASWQANARRVLELYAEALEPGAAAGAVSSTPGERAR